MRITGRRNVEHFGAVLSNSYPGRARKALEAARGQGAAQEAQREDLDLLDRYERWRAAPLDSRWNALSQQKQAARIREGLREVEARFGTSRTSLGSISIFRSSMALRFARRRRDGDLLFFEDWKATKALATAPRLSQGSPITLSWADPVVLLLCLGRVRPSTRRGPAQTGFLHRALLQPIDAVRRVLAGDRTVSDPFFENCGAVEAAGVEPASGGGHRGSSPRSWPQARRASRRVNVPSCRLFGVAYRPGGGNNRAMPRQRRRARKP